MAKKNKKPETEVSSDVIRVELRLPLALARAIESDRGKVLRGTHIVDLLCKHYRIESLVDRRMKADLS